jgi:methionyl-tRNA formyltransferase
MKLIFAGTPVFAARSLTALHDAGHHIALVLTQPDRPAGRGMKLTPSAVAEEAARLGLPVAKPTTLKDETIQQTLAAVQADVMVVAAYGLLLPQNVLDLPLRGCLNIHGSLLPRWRGAAPVQRAIEAGDRETGIAIMQMDAGLDTGPVLLAHKIEIGLDDTSGALFEKLTALGARSIVEALSNLDNLEPIAQPDEGVTYAKKIGKPEARIDWTLSATELERRIRAFDPFPGCETMVNAVPLKIWRARVVPAIAGRSPGTVIESAADRLVVQCGTDALSLTIVQKPGGKRMSIADYQRGHDMAPGSSLT